MKITCLIENESFSPGLKKEKGLSLLISTAKHKILFDSGMGDGFSRNAEKLAVDLRDVDIAFVSHGHFDHGLGVGEFLRINPTADVYLQKTAFERHYVNNFGIYIYRGLDQKIATNPRIKTLETSTVIDDELKIIAGITPKKAIKNLFMKNGGGYLPDTFTHEQSLVITENGKKTLISGCSHCGIDRILSAAQESCGKIDCVVGGFHLIAYDFDKPADLEEVDTLANGLLASGAMCYTCHCTSVKGYHRLKRIMGDHIGYLSTGNTLWI